MNSKKKKYFLFPKPHLKHLLFLFFFISSFAKKFVQIFLEGKESLALEFFKLYVYNFGDFLTIIPFLIIKKRSKQKKEDNKDEELTRSGKVDKIDYLVYDPSEKVKKNEKGRTKYILIITISDFISQISTVIFHIIKEEEKLKVTQSKLNSLLAFNAIVIVLFSRIFLDIRFYSHHWFSFLLNILCLLALSVIDIIEIINDSGDSILTSVIYIIIKLFSKILYSIEDVLAKVIFLFYFFSPYSLLLAKSILQFFYLALFSFPFIFIKITNEKNENKLIFSMIGDIFEEKNYILIEILFSIISFFYNLFLFKIIDEFSPNHFIIAKVVENLGIFIINIILKGADNEKNLIAKIILFILLILASLIFNEFIVINICGLSKNTKLFLDYEAKNEIISSKIYDNEDVRNDSEDFSSRATINAELELNDLSENKILNSE